MSLRTSVLALLIEAQACQLGTSSSVPRYLRYLLILAGTLVLYLGVAPELACKVNGTLAVLVGVIHIDVWQRKQLSYRW